MENTGEPQLGLTALLGGGVSIGQLLNSTIPKPTHELKWGEDMPRDVFAALQRGETATLMNKHGQPHSLVLMDYFGTIRERLL